MPTLTERNKLAVTGALAIALGLVVGVSLGGSDKPTKTAAHEAIGDAIAKGSATEPAAPVIDTAVYNEAIKEIRAEDPTAIDLLSPFVEPGAEVTTYVTIDLGRRTTGEVEYIGPDADVWETVSVEYIDATKTSVEVRARNMGKTAARLIGIVHLEAP